MSLTAKRERQITWLARILIVSATVVAIFYIFHSEQDRYSTAHSIEFAEATPSGLAIIPASGAAQSSYTGAYTGTYTGAYTSSYGGGLSYVCNSSGTSAQIYYPTCSGYPCGYDDPYHYYAWYYSTYYGVAYGGIQLRADRTDNGWAPACNNTFNDGYPGDTCITSTPVTGAWSIYTTPSANYTIAYQTYTTFYGWRPTYSTSLYCPAPPPTCTLTATVNPINRGGSTTLTWSSTNATSFSINNIGAVATAGSTSVTPSATTNYGATVTGLGGTVSCPLTVTVNQPTATMTVNGGAASATVNVGDSTTWNWSSTYGSSYVTYLTLNQADGCGASVGPFAWAQGATASGSYTTTWPACTAGRTYTYNYRVTNSAGYQIYASPVTVTVNPLPACTISMNPTSILRGSNSALNWATTNASTGSISPTPGTVGTASQQFSISPNVTTTYTGTVTAAGSGSPTNLTYTSSGTWTVPAGVTSIDALVVAGGGGGAGGASGAGGGGGGVRQLTSIAVTPGSTLTITVGAGGAGGATGTSGGDSSITSGASTLALSTGGGGGGNEGENGKAGGSGGGGGGSLPGAGGAGTAGQGNAGGAGSGGTRHAGGGGGAGAAGVAGASNGAGGAGVTVGAVYGSLVLGGGGGGAAERAWGSGPGGAGGSGGGGQACGPSGVTDSNGVAGTANTGGGGGGGGRCGSGATAGLVGGNGGSGLVIIRYTPAGNTAQCSATLTVTCAPIYSCSGSTLQYTDASCNTSNVATCTAPSSCVAGQSACVNPPPAFTPGTSGAGAPLTGDLEANPQLVRKGASARLYWNVSNIASCTVTGNNGDTLAAGCSGNTCTSGSGGRATIPITSSAVYSLRCTSLSGVTPANFNHTVTVLPSPEYEEQ